MQSLRTHIVIDQSESIEPRAYCYISNPLTKTNHQTSLEQLSTIFTLKELLNQHPTETNSRLIQALQIKTGLYLKETIERLKTHPLQIFYYLDSDGGDQHMSDTIEGLNDFVKKSQGQSISLVANAACGSSGIAFFTSSNNHRFHSSHSVSGISLNMLESYFLANLSELQEDFEYFYQMQQIVINKQTKINQLILESSTQDIESLRTEILKQTTNANNHHQVKLSNDQLKKYGISTEQNNHFETISQFLPPEEIQLTLEIPKVYDFLESNSCSYH